MVAAETLSDLGTLESTASDHELCPRLCSSRARAARSAVQKQETVETDRRHKKSFAYSQQSHPLPTCGRYGRRRDRAMSKLNGRAQFSDHPPCPSLSQQLADRRCFTLSALERTASDHELCPRLCSSRARAPRSAVQ